MKTLVVACGMAAISLLIVNCNRSSEDADSSAVQEAAADPLATERADYADGVR